MFKKEGQLVDDEFLEKLRAIIIMRDMGPEAAERIINQIGTEFRARVVHMQDVVDIVRRQLKELLSQDMAPIRLADEGPTVIMVAGVNGAGKTTSIAKLANMFISDGKRVVLGAGDTFRAAAVEQLTIWASASAPKLSPAPPGAIRPAWRTGRSPRRSSSKSTCASLTPPGGCKPSRT